MNPIAFLLALMVHLLPFAAIPPKETPPANPPKEVRLLGGVDDMRFRAFDGVGMGLACEDTYDGVGIRHNWGGQITEVAQGGPAWRAGVRVGDEYVASGDDGEYRTLRYRQNGVEKALRTKRESICQDRA